MDHLFGEKLMGFGDKSLSNNKYIRYENWNWSINRKMFLTKLELRRLKIDKILKDEILH